MVTWLISFTVFFLPWCLLALGAAWLTVWVVNCVLHRSMSTLSVIVIWIIYSIPVYIHVMQ